MKAVLGWGVALLVVIAWTPAGAQESLVLYDDFSARLIDGNKWIGSATDFGTEAVRRVVPASPPDQTNRELHLAYRGFGATTSDSGTTFSALRLNFAFPDSITAARATVRVREAQATGCAANPDDTLAFARLSGVFFNATAFPTPGSSVNDVFAQIRLQRVSSLPELRVRARVVLCLDSDCFADSLIGAADLGPASEGTAVTLAMRWDPDNDRFVFQRDMQQEVIIPYTVSDASLPGLARKRLDVTHFVANCTTDPRPEAFMDVRFDDVFVNESAAPSP